MNQPYARFVAGGEVVGTTYNPDPKFIARCARRFAKAYGLTVYVEQWTTVDTFEPEGTGRNEISRITREV